MKRILVIGPFGDFGGRELEAGFIVKTLGDDYHVRLCSTIFMSDRSQVFNFIDRESGFSVLEKVYERNPGIRLAAWLSRLKNKKRLPAYAFVKNSFNKRFFNVQQKIISNLHKELENADLVFICAQLSSEYIAGIIYEADLLQKPVVFRTTGTIRPAQIQLLYLKNVKLFVHHSQKNASLLPDHRHKVIDQACFAESALLKISIEFDAIRNFTFLGRISEEKGILELLKLFGKFAAKEQRLHIYGEGPLKTQAISIAKSDDRIKFHGFVDQDELVEVFQNTDCLIIPSREEAGPLSGLEAMAAGKIILSTNVGAMIERLETTDNDFWFDLKDDTSFKTQLERISNLKPEELKAIGRTNRERYLEAYTILHIQKQYKACVDGLF